MTRTTLLAALMALTLTACGDPAPTGTDDGIITVEGTEEGDGMDERTDLTPVRTPGPIEEVEDVEVTLEVSVLGDSLTPTATVRNVGDMGIAVAEMRGSELSDDDDVLTLRFLAFDYGPVGDGPPEDAAGEAPMFGGPAVVVAPGDEVELTTQGSLSMSTMPARIRVCLEVNRLGDAEATTGRETDLALWEEGQPVLVACSEAVDVPE
jgi:hypothetical protein